MMFLCSQSINQTVRHASIESLICSLVARLQAAEEWDFGHQECRDP